MNIYVVIYLFHSTNLIFPNYPCKWSNRSYLEVMEYDSGRRATQESGRQCPRKEKRSLFAYWRNTAKC